MGWYLKDYSAPRHMRQAPRVGDDGEACRWLKSGGAGILSCVCRAGLSPQTGGTIEELCYFELAYPSA